MPSLIVTSSTTAQDVADERLDKRWKVTSLTIDNDAGDDDAVIRVQDIFTPAKTHGVSDPSETTVDRFRATILQGDVVAFNESDLEGVECLGDLKVIGSAVDTDCHITVGYKPS